MKLLFKNVYPLCLCCVMKLYELCFRFVNERSESCYSLINHCILIYFLQTELIFVDRNMRLYWCECDHVLIDLDNSGNRNWNIIFIYINQPFFHNKRRDSFGPKQL